MAAACASSMSQLFLTFGDWTVRPGTGSIERQRCRRLLEPRWMDVLVHLAGRAGETVSADELLAACWPGEAHGDNPVHKCIAMLRKALGDDARAPRYIATVRKRGYRVLARVVFSDGREQTCVSTRPWAGGSPYPGPRPFRLGDAPLYFGRRQHRIALLSLLREVHDGRRGLVLVAGDSGCGTTSLVQAGIAPSLLQAAGYDGLHAVAWAAVEHGMPAEPLLALLARAMCQWQVDGHRIFADTEQAVLAGSLPDDIERVLGRVRARLHSPGEVLLLMVDALDVMLSDASEADAVTFIQILLHLARSGVILVIATADAARADRVLRLASLTDTRDGIARFDVSRAGPGELANMIRLPAALAGLTFEEDPLTERRLDDVLLADASLPPVRLAWLQHTLSSLFLAREAGNLLTFRGYRSCTHPS